MDTSVGVVLLASENQFPEAGPKNLLPFFHEPVITRCIDRILDSGIKDIAVVTGPDGYEVGAALEDYPVCIVVSDSPVSDTRAQVKLGLNALPRYTTGLIIANCSKSQACFEDYGFLANVHHRAPQYAVTPGRPLQDSHPALLPVEMPPTELDNIVHLERHLKKIASGVWT